MLETTSNAKQSTWVLGQKWGLGQAPLSRVSVTRWGQKAGKFSFRSRALRLRHPGECGVLMKTRNEWLRTFVPGSPSEATIPHVDSDTSIRSTVSSSDNTALTQTSNSEEWLGGRAHARWTPRRTSRFESQEATPRVMPRSGHGPPWVVLWALGTPG